MHAELRTQWAQGSINYSGPCHRKTVRAFQERGARLYKAADIARCRAHQLQEATARTVVQLASTPRSSHRSTNRGHRNSNSTMLVPHKPTPEGHPRIKRVPTPHPVPD